MNIKSVIRMLALTCIVGACAYSVFGARPRSGRRRFRDNIKNYLELTGQVEGGKKKSSNTEASSPAFVWRGNWTG